MWSTVSGGEPGADQNRDIPVVFVHGQPGLGSDFDPVAELLGPAFRVISPDRPGYGASGQPPTSMRQNVEVFADLIEERDLGPAIVVGHSYGGGIAVLLAARSVRTSCQGSCLPLRSEAREHLGAVDRLLAVPIGRRRARRRWAGRSRHSASSIAGARQTCSWSDWTLDGGKPAGRELRESRDARWRCVAVRGRRAAGTLRRDRRRRGDHSDAPASRRGGCREHGTSSFRRSSQRARRPRFVERSSGSFPQRVIS